MGGKLYVLGGFTGGWEGVGSVYEYDPAANVWRTRAPLPTPRGALAVATSGGKIYAFAGETRPGLDTPANEEYTPRHGLAAVAVGNRIYVISGGPRPGGSYNNTNEVFFPE